jgi:hypothetical protein
MNERDSFEILLDYPAEHGLVYETHQDNKRFYLFASDPILRTKYVVFKIDSLTFLAYDSFAAKAYMNKTFTGIYQPVMMSENIELKAYKKDWMDYFIRFRKIKTGQKYIDDNLTITSKSKNASKLLTDQTVTLFNKINQSISPLQLLIQNDYLSIVRDFEGKNVIGLETNQWIYKKEELDVFINSGRELIETIVNACAELAGNRNENYTGIQA